MFTSIIGLLAGSFFRMVWGEISAAWKARQDHAHELALMKAQEERDAAQHARNIESMKLQQQLGVETIRVQGDAELSRLGAVAWGNSVAEGNKLTGIKLVDAWNAVVRPAAASVALWVWVSSMHTANWVIVDRDWDLVCAILGWFFADRTLAKRGK